jgi:hypothetical protein
MRSKTMWQTVNQAAHTQINYLLTGERPKNAAVTPNLTRDTAQYIFDTVVRYLRLGIRSLALLA